VLDPSVVVGAPVIPIAPTVLLAPLDFSASLFDAIDALISASLSGSFGMTELWLILGVTGLLTLLDAKDPDPIVVDAGTEYGTVSYKKLCVQSFSDGFHISPFNFAFSAFGVNIGLGFHSTEQYNHATVFVVAFGLTKGQDVVFPLRATPYSVYGQFVGTCARYSMGMGPPDEREVCHHIDAASVTGFVAYVTAPSLAEFMPEVNVNLLMSEFTTAVFRAGIASTLVDASNVFIHMDNCSTTQNKLGWSEWQKSWIPHTKSMLGV
jgi:hypothetical protein